MRVRSRLFAACLPVAAVVGAQFTTACAPSDAPTPETSEPEFTARNCIVEAPLRGDGYTEILEADAAKVTRKRLGADGSLVEDPDKVSRPSQPQLTAAMTKISKHLDRIQREVPESARRTELYSTSTRGSKPEPYCLFHAAGKAVYGTVVLFHGFNDRPHQQAKLASYLFHAGFNVYNVFLANMYIVEAHGLAGDRDATGYWPKTVYKPAVLATAQAKLGAPENQAKLAPVIARVQAGQPLTDTDNATIDSVLGPELGSAALTAAWKNPGGAEWAKIYAVREPKAGENLMDAARESDFMDYVRDATARIDDVADLPGPIFVGGLSVGATVALAAAEADGGRRVRSVIAHAPWIQAINPQDNQTGRLVGPLHHQVAALGGQYPIRWQNHDIGFSPASISADLALGAWSAKPENLAKLARISTAMVVTDDEDSADNAASAQVHGALAGDPRVAALHTHVAYPKEMHVRHALTDPENYVEAANWNRQWRSLYQESFRFYTQGTMNAERMMKTAEDPALPKTACVMPDYPERCGQ